MGGWGGGFRVPAGGGGRGAGRVAKTSLLKECFVTPAKGDTEKRSKRLCFSSIQKTLFHSPDRKFVRFLGTVGSQYQCQYCRLTLQESGVLKIHITVSHLCPDYHCPYSFSN